MRLPFTDKFLWDLYSFIEKTGKTFDLFALRTIKEAFYPDFYKLRRKYERNKAKREFSQFVNYLKKKGYIKIKGLKEKQGIILTKKGADKVLTIKFKTKEKKRRPDGKWQMIIFDIPEKKRHLRNLLRENLHFLGYKILQQSVWICPYDVLKETEGFLRKHTLDPYVKLFLIEET